MRILEFATDWWQFVLVALVAYFIGNVNFAVIISKLKHKDIREEGSGNPGTLNMSRTFGLEIGIITLILDMLKGAIPTYVAYLIFRDALFLGYPGFCVGDMAQMIAGLFVVLGHIYPVAFKFKGGKGVASTIGVFFVLHPIFAISMVALAIIFVYFTELGSVGSFIAITPPAVYFTVEKIMVYHDVPCPAVALWLMYGCAWLIVALVYFAHRKNIVRLFKGEEHPTSVKDLVQKFRKK